MDLTMPGKFLLIVCLVLLPCASYAAAPVEKPEDIALILQQAMRTNSTAQALSHIDLNALLNNVFDSSLPQLTQAMDKGEVEFSLPVTMALGGLNSGNMLTRKAAVAFFSTEAQKFIRFGIESGAFSGDIQPSSVIDRLDAGLFARKDQLQAYKCAFIPAKLLERRGKGAVVATVLQADSLRDLVPLELCLEERDGLWNIVDVRNAPELLTWALGGHSPR
jgi:hypothetical protein